MRLIVKVEEASWGAYLELATVLSNDVTFSRSFATLDSPHPRRVARDDQEMIKFRSNAHARKHKKGPTVQRFYPPVISDTLADLKKASPEGEFCWQSSIRLKLGSRHLQSDEQQEECEPEETHLQVREETMDFGPRD